MPYLRNIIVVSYSTKCESWRKLFNLVFATVSLDNITWPTKIPRRRIFIRIIETAVLLNAPLLVHKLFHKLPILLTRGNLLLDAVNWVRIWRWSRLCDRGILGQVLRIIWMRQVGLIISCFGSRCSPGTAFLNRQLMFLLFHVVLEILRLGNLKLLEYLGLLLI